MRRQYVSHPQFQYSFITFFSFGVIWVFAIIAGVGVLSLFVLAGNTGLEVAQADLLRAATRSWISEILMILGVSVLIFLFMGIFLSYKFVGPLSRLEKWLERVLNGENPRGIVLRPGDELAKLVKFLNEIYSQHRGKLK